MKKLCLALFAALAGATFVSAEEVYIDARALPEKKGWVQEGEFMRSLAAGTSLSGTFTASKAGVMHLNVYTMTHGGNTRKAAIIINGKNCGSFGDEPLAEGKKAGFYWVKGTKPIIVKEGGNTVLIKGMPYARLSFVILSDNPDFVPPDVSDF